MNTPTELMPREGVIHDLSIEAYHGDKTAVSKSGLDDMARSPFHYWSRHLDPNRPAEEPRTGGRLAGALLHCALLEPDQFDARYVSLPADAPARPTEAMRNAKSPSPESVARVRWWDDWTARTSGKTIITAEQRDAAKRQADACRALPEVRDALSKGHAEVSAYWRDPETGVLCRCRPDWVTPVGTRQVIHLDAKTYSNASPDEFRRQIARMAYHRQDAWYWDGYQHASGHEVVAFLFVAVELEWPYAASTVMLDDAAREQGRRENRRLLDTYARCLRDNQWPAFPGGPHPVSLPAWALDKE